MTKDIESPTNFHDIAEARKWADEANEQRPYRADFIERISSEINNLFKNPISILEIGAGPGFLADHVLHSCKIESYLLLDFSDAMHRLAKERLEAFKDKTHFLKSDFKAEKWTEDLADYDIVVTLQSAHEVRHKSRIELLFLQIRKLIRDDGYFLMCDHCIEGMKNGNPELYLTRDGLHDALKKAGYGNIDLLKEKGSLVLFRASKI